MKLQVLLATMNQREHTLPSTMNINCDVIVGNQCDRNAVTEFTHNGHHVTWLDTTGRGLSRNRNLALLFATADICLLADDDLVYDAGYVARVCDAFARYPDTDVLLFDIRGASGHIPHPMRIRWYNCLRWGSVRIAFRLKRVQEAGIFFHLGFGAGTPRGYGEDTLFLTACLRRGFTIRALPITIASLTDTRPSTWFRGYDTAYFQNKGHLFREIAPHFAWALCLQDAVRHRRRYGVPWYRAFRLMRGKHP